MKNYLLLIASIAVIITTAAQKVGIGTTTPHASAALEIKSNNKGVLIPRTSTTSRNAIVSPAKGLMLYDTTTSSFWFYNGAAWANLSAGGAANGWSLTGNAGTNPVNNFLGTTDNQPLRFRIKNIYAGEIDSVHSKTFLGYAAGLNTTALGNTGIGTKALNANTTGGYNTASGLNALLHNTIGGNNTATGAAALQNNTIGINNSAHGMYGLYLNTSGGYNTASGFEALYSNVDGSYNTAVGALALYNNGIGANVNADEGTRNTAVGEGSMYANTTGLYNTAVGVASLAANTWGFFNTAIGLDALQHNVGGRDNTALGLAALDGNTSGDYNTAAGSRSLSANTTGYSNVAVGASALYNSTNQSNLVAIGDSALFNQGPYVGGEFPILGLNTATGSKSLFTNTYGQANTANGYRSLYNNSNGTHNTAIGISALNNNSNGNYNTAVGAYADVSSGSLSNATSIGYGAVATTSNQVMLGNTFITSVRAAGSFVIYSDGRFKNNIKDNVPGLDFIKMLKPVTYNYNIHGLQAHLTGNDLTKRRTSNNLKQDEDAMTAKEKKIYTGFVAQDVEAAANKLHYNFSGVYKPQNETDAYGLSYADFVVPLVKAVQEQQAIIEEQNKKIEMLIDEMRLIKAKLK
jgi:hypothetical protein